MDPMDDIVKEFLVESYENLDRLDQDLLALEKQPDDRDRLSSVFRTIHTIKGTSGFLAFPNLEHVAHVGENLLVLLRDGKLHLNGPIASGLLTLVDAVRTILRDIEASGVEGSNDYADLVARLEQLKVTGGEASGAATVEEAQRVGELLDFIDSEVQAACDEAEPVAVATKAPAKRKRSGGSGKPARRSADSVVTLSVTEPVAQTVIVLPGRDGSLPAAASRAPAPAAPAPANEHPEEADKSQSIADASVRINVNLLDKLMNLVGELVLTRNQVLQYSRTNEDQTLTAASQRLNLITSELQEGIMKTRMQPIHNAWSKLPRVVRDLALSCGKQVQVKMEGAETELDKTILEAIKDPLTHIVRNSVDHGIEPTDVRLAAGKPAEGTLWLRAFHEGGQVNIEVCDDGGGINLERVKQKALSQRQITDEQAATMSDRELTSLILLPGFSTAEKVTNVSGRGVGMDVVKTNVEKIGGTLDIHSVAGQGTTLRIKIPLTLAIVPALTVICQEDRFCIPQVSLLELLRLEGDRVRSGIELIHSVPVYRLRGQLLPLLYLDEQLGLRSRRTNEERRAADCVSIVVLQAEGRSFGLVVDSVIDTQEIVVKPLGPHLKGIPAYAGATIMGDGSVSLILDVFGLAQTGGVLNEQSRNSQSDESSTAGSSNQQKKWLVVDPGDGGRAAISLAEVARLEEIKPQNVERNGADEVVQYRGKIMPLLRLCSSWSASSQNSEADDSGASQSFPVVVYQKQGRPVGIVVGQILDIVEHTLEADPGESSETESQIISGRVTRVIDLGALVGAAV